MSLANYSDLLSSVASYLHRTDLTSVIPDFVRLAESEFNRVLRIPGQVTHTTLSATSASTALPSNFIAMKAVTLTFGGVNYMIPPQSEEMVRSYTDAGTPQVYCLSGTNIVLGPAPSGTCTLGITYFAQIPALATNTTNHLMTLYPDLYLWRSVFEGAKYTRDDALVALAGNEYQRVLGDVMQRESSRQWPTAPQMRVA